MTGRSWLRNLDEHVDVETVGLAREAILVASFYRPRRSELLEALVVVGFPVALAVGLRLEVELRGVLTLVAYVSAMLALISALGRRRLEERVNTLPGNALRVLARAKGFEGHAAHEQFLAVRLERESATVRATPTGEVLHIDLADRPRVVVGRLSGRIRAVTFGTLPAMPAWSLWRHHDRRSLR